jgi:Ca2+-binding RTX toxin-like protein
VSGQNTSFTNSGTITAIATGNFPSMGVTVAGGGVVINNSGTIAGDYAIWENQIFVTPQEWSQSIQNSGTLIGAVDLGLGRDVVDNSGLIDGLVDLGDGNDIYYGTLGVVLEPVIGGRGDDTLIGGYGDEVLVGYDDLSEDPPADSDILVGGGGSDVLLAGAGDDYLYIDHLDAVIDAGEGYDAIVIQDDTGTSLDVGAASAEWVYAWTDDDTLDASSSAAGVALVGEAGSDVLIGSAHNDYIYMDAFDTVDAGDGYDALFVYQGSGQGVVDTFIDVSAANAEWVLGGAGNDIITNLGDVDGVALSGGGGNDQLTGGLGNDYLYGNEGSDTFIVTSNAQLDAILDFEVAVDKVDLGAIGGIVDFAGLVAASTESGGSTMLDLGGGSQLLLYGVPLASLSAGDFIFSA